MADGVHEIVLAGSDGRDLTQISAYREVGGYESLARARTMEPQAVLDALLAAGGMTGDADLFALNKAAPLRDGMRIYVPRPGEAVPAGSAGSQAETKVNINAASANELDALPGIGPTTAAAIVRSRSAKPFASINELQTRGLVSPRVLADVRDLVTIK